MRPVFGETKKQVQKQINKKRKSLKIHRIFRSKQLSIKKHQNELLENPK